MAQSSYTPIQLYYSSTTTNTPTAGNLANGELAINITDGKLFYKDNAGVVQVIATKASAGGVSSFSAGTTGLTPNSATSGAITLAGTLVVGNGGTGLTTLATGSLPYGAGTSAFSSLAIGTAGQVLTVNSGATAPQYVNQSTLSVGSATTATNLAGGLAGSVPYNTGAGATTFLSIGTAGQVLTVNSGATAPQYVAQSTLSVGKATNIAGGAANQIHYQSAADTTAFITAPSVSSTFLQWNGTTFVWAAAGGTTTNALTIGTGLSGTSFNGSAAVTIAIDSTVATLTGSQTLTNKTLTSPVISTITNTGTLTLPTSTDTLVGRATTDTLTNKRINPRVSTTTSSSSAVTPDISAYDQYNWTAQAATLTINAPTGTPVDGNKLIFRILDNGTTRTLTWDATYTVIGVTLPTSTTASKTTYVGCIYNANNTRWDVIAVATQA